MWRNAAKRRMRAVCHDVGGPWDGQDVIFLAKKPIMEQTFAKTRDDIARIVRRALAEGAVTSHGEARSRSAAPVAGNEE